MILEGRSPVFSDWILNVHHNYNKSTVISCTGLEIKYKSRRYSTIHIPFLKMKEEHHFFNFRVTREYLTGRSNIKQLCIRREGFVKFLA